MTAEVVSRISGIASRTSGAVSMKSAYEEKRHKVEKADLGKNM